MDSIQLPPYREDDLEDVPAAGVRIARARKEAAVERARATDSGQNLESDHDAIVRTGAWKRSIQGYLAAIAFMDENLGRLVDAIESSPRRDDTIVVLWSDHGWHLGEKHHWRKSTLWEEATRAPMVWIVPGLTRPDTVCDRTVDHMSIQPTLLDLAGIAVPAHVEGVSIRTLLENPTAPWDRPAVTTHLQGNHSARTERWRYIRYADGSEELDDERADPNEWMNLAAKPDLAAVKIELARWLPALMCRRRTPPSGIALASRRSGSRMDRREFLRAAIAAPLGARFATGGGRRRDKPNLLFLWADQQRPDTMRVYGNEVHAPSFNQLARNAWSSRTPT